MRISKDDFVKKWRKHLAAVALFGYVSESKDKPMERAAKIMDIPADTDALLARIYDDLDDRKPNGATK